MWVDHVDEISNPFKGDYLTLVQRIAFVIQVINKGVEFFIYQTFHGFVLELFIDVSCVFMISLSFLSLFGFSILGGRFIHLEAFV